MSEELKKSAGQSGEDGNKFKRNKKFSVMVTDAEYSKIEKNALKSGENSMAAYARIVLTTDQNSRIKTKKNNIDYLRLLGSLGKIGNNINQISKALNQKTELSVAMLNEIKLFKCQFDSIVKELKKDK